MYAYTVWTAQELIGTANRAVAMQPKICNVAAPSRRAPDGSPGPGPAASHQKSTVLPEGHLDPGGGA
jgi:hypothetical protein